MLDTVKVVIAVFIVALLYVLVSGMIIYKRQQFQPLIKQNCTVLPRCFKQSSQQIPKNIVRVGDTIIPNTFEKTQDSNQGYNQIHVSIADAEKLLAQHPFWFRAYQKINSKYARARFNILTYICMFHYGGVYLDMNATVDSLCKLIKPTDTLLISPWPTPVSVGFLKNVPSTGDYQHWWFAVTPRHAFLRQLLNAVTYNIENFNPELHATGRLGAIYLTGSDIFTQTMNRMANEGFTDYRIVCPNGNNLFHHTKYNQLFPWYSHMKEYVDGKETVVME